MTRSSDVLSVEEDMAKREEAKVSARDVGWWVVKATADVLGAA